MLGARKIERYKKAVSVLLLIFCAALGVVIILGLISNLTPNNVVLLRTNAGTVKLELTDNITLEDNTADKLKQKLKITDTGTQGELGALVKVTANNIMFDYTKDEKIYYFTAIGSSLNTADETKYINTKSSTFIYTKDSLTTFQNYVNKDTKNTYSGSTVYLMANIDYGGDTWYPIGLGDHSFNGTFEGNGHTVSNFVIKTWGSKGIGFFGNADGATINNLQLSNAKLTNTVAYSGLLVGYANETTISYCSVSSSCSIDVTGFTQNITWSVCSFDNKGLTMTQKQDMNIGGMCGYMSGGKMEQCSSRATIKCGFDGDGKTDSSIILRMLNVGGIIGGGYNMTLSKCLYGGSITTYGKHVTAVRVAGLIGSTYKSTLEYNYVEAKIYQGITVEVIKITTTKSFLFIKTTYSLSTAGCQYEDYGCNGWQYYLDNHADADQYLEVGTSSLENSSVTCILNMMSVSVVVA